MRQTLVKRVQSIETRWASLDFVDTQLGDDVNHPFKVVADRCEDIQIGSGLQRRHVSDIIPFLSMILRDSFGRTERSNVGLLKE